MRFQLLASTVLATLTIGSAFAAPPATPFTWTGCYVGLHAGVDWGTTRWTATSSANTDGDGAIGGAQAGCNYQIQSFVVGGEGEIWGSGLTESAIADAGLQALKAHSDVAGDLAARFGYAIDRALIFGKVGVASANYHFTDNVDDPGVGVFPYAARATFTGLLLGLGLEYALDDHWSLKGEYDYVNYGSKNVLFIDGGLNGIVAIHSTENLLKAGANYRF